MTGAVTTSGMTIGSDVEGRAGRDLVAAFEDLSLPNEQFNHRCHLQVAWIYLNRYGFPQAAVRFIDAVRSYATHVGAPHKYHETITWAYMVLLNEELSLRSAPGETFEQLIRRRPEFLSHRNGPLFRYYSEAQLNREEARRLFMLPGPSDRTST